MPSNPPAAQAPSNTPPWRNQPVELPTGPFIVQQTNASVLQLPGGDFDIFTEGSEAYIIYTSHLTEPKGERNHMMSVERLRPDWLSSSGESSGFFGSDFVEAPVMLKRGAFYYALFDHCCCFCGGGSGAIVHTAPHPLGPWTAQNQIGAYANGSSVTQAQQRSVFAYPHAAAEPVWVWMGNRWQSAPDGVKDHDFETWLPIEFAPQAGETPPLPKPMVWQDSWSLGPA